MAQATGVAERVGTAWPLPPFWSCVSSALEAALSIRCGARLFLLGVVEGSLLWFVLVAVLEPYNGGGAVEIRHALLLGCGAVAEANPAAAFMAKSYVRFGR